MTDLFSLQKILTPITLLMMFLIKCLIIMHSQQEAYMDLVENSGGGSGGGSGRQEIEERQGML